jgi:hypothetical protein
MRNVYTIIVGKSEEYYLGGWDIDERIILICN